MAVDVLEFIGPLSGGLDMQSDYGIVGNGTTDDSNGVEDFFEQISTTGIAPHGFTHPGEIRLTRTINITNRAYFKWYCEHPEDVRFKWDGPAGGPMFRVNGVMYSTLGRFTIDPNGDDTLVCIEQAWDGSTGFFDTGNKYEDIWVDGVAAYFIKGGGLDFGFAETSILRCRGDGVVIGIWLGNGNALDIYARDNWFKNCYAFMSNENGAGTFRAERNILEGNTIDFLITSGGVYSFIRNWSKGSYRFINAANLAAPGIFLVHRNSILDTGDALSMIIGNQGPVSLISNRIRSRAAVTTGPVSQIDCSVDDEDIISFGNQWTVPVAGTIDNGTGRLTQDDTEVTVASLPDNRPDLQPVPPNVLATRTVIECAPTDEIQDKIAAARVLSGTKPYIHIQYGENDSNGTTIAGDDMRFVGDGIKSRVVGTMGITGPSTVQFYDLFRKGVTLQTIDQIGARLYLENVNLRNCSTALLNYDQCDHIIVEANEIGIAGTDANVPAIRVRGGPLAQAGTPAGGKVNIYSGASSNMGRGFDVALNGMVLAVALWYEESIRSCVHLKTEGAARVTLATMNTILTLAEGGYQINNLVGKVTLLSHLLQSTIEITGDSSAGQVLAAGIVNGPTYLTNLDPDPYFVNSGGAEAGLLNSRKWTAIPGQQTEDTPNIGTVTTAFVNEMLEHINGETPRALTAFASNITDVRFFNVWIADDVNGIHLIGGGDDGGSAMAQITRLGQFGIGLSNYGTFAPAGAVVPDAPTIGAAVGGNTTASVAFTPPVDDGGAAITGYTATSTPGSHTGSGAGSPVTVAGLTNGTPYTFTVHATNIIGNSAESAASNSVTPSAPASDPGGGTQVKGNLRWAAGLRRAEPDDNEEENQDAENAAAALLLVS